MRILHQKLHLQHHRHSGKWLHHRHTSYRSLGVVLVLAGVSMGGIAVMQRAAAESLVSISVNVHVPRPQSPAIIAVPEDGAKLPGSETVIAGSCPVILPQAVILVIVDDEHIGSAICDASNNFSISANLVAGAHTIVADAISIDGDRGPSSQPVHVTIQAAPPAKPGAASVTTPAAVPTITSDSTFAVIDASKSVEWTGVLHSNASDKTPYSLIIDWNDGTYDTYDIQSGPQQARHHYASLASHNIIVAVSDGAGGYSRRQFAATASSAEIPTPVGAAVTNIGQSSQAATVAGLYGFFVTMVCVFALIRLHAAPFAYADIKLGHHGS